MLSCLEFSRTQAIGRLKGGVWRGVGNSLFKVRAASFFVDRCIVFAPSVPHSAGFYSDTIPNVPDWIALSCQP